MSNIRVIKECKYRLPCGWCDRKNELCQYEMQTQDIKEVLDRLPTEDIASPIHIEGLPDIQPTNNPTCEHEWYCSGADTQGWTYTCRKCGKIERRNYSHVYTPGTPLWINPDAPKIGDFPPYNNVTCTSGYINTNECPEQQVSSILTTNVTTSAQSATDELSEAEKFVAEVKAGRLPKMKETR